jgi:hypothetical protein
MIQIHNITKRYGEGKGVFNLTFSYRKGKSSVTSDRMAPGKPPPSATCWVS